MFYGQPYNVYVASLKINFLERINVKSHYPELQISRMFPWTYVSVSL